MLSSFARDDRQALQVYKDTLAYDDKNTEVGWLVISLLVLVLLDRINNLWAQL